MSDIKVTVTSVSATVADLPVRVSYTGLGAGEEPTMLVSIQLNRVDETALKRVIDAVELAVKK